MFFLEKELKSCQCLGIRYTLNCLTNWEQRDTLKGAKLQRRAQKFTARCEDIGNEHPCLGSTPVQGYSALGSWTYPCPVILGAQHALGGMHD